MRYWAIAPYEKKHQDRFVEYWNDGLANGYISIGWNITNPKGVRKKGIERLLKLARQYDSQAPSTIDKFMNKIEVGDIIVARRGINEAIGIGQVTRNGYYDEEKCRNLTSAQYDHHKMFVDVEWDKKFRGRKIGSRAFHQITVVEIKEDSRPFRLAPWLLELIAAMHPGAVIVRDIEEIRHDSAIGETLRIRLIQARVGQGQFRRDVLAKWGGQCGLSGIRNGRLLIASHIKPWAESTNEERLDPENGIMLCASLDKAFDAGLISFRDNGEILVSSELHVDDVRILGILPHAMLAIRKGRMTGYLKIHRDRYFPGTA